MILHNQGLIRVLAAVVFVTVCGAGAVRAQTPAAPMRGAATDDAQVLRALLTEVRELRMTLQRVNVKAYRMQIGLERLRQQQARVDQFSRELTEVRMNLAEATANRPRMAERLKEMEARFNQETDPAVRANLEAECKDFKYNLEQLVTSLEQQKARESELSRILQEEQDRLDQISAQLDSLSRELERGQFAESP